MRQNKSFSWGLILLMLILFFPVGIYMIVKKVTTEKFNYINNGKALKVLGWVLIGLGIIYIIPTDSEAGSDTVGSILFGILLFGGLGALSLLKGFKYEKLGKKYARYVSIVNTTPNTSINAIAAAVPTTYEQAVKDLQSMINSGYFMNTYLDLNRGELVRAYSNFPQNNYNFTPNTAYKPNLQRISTKCPSCGAPNNIVKGTANECEFCGSPLQ